MSETAANSAPWPAMSIADAHALLTGEGSPLEMEEKEIRGVKMRVWKNAPGSLREVLEVSRGHGNLDFLVYEGERVTFEAHYRAVAKLATALQKKYGIEKGDRVAIAMRNYPEWVIAFWAAAAVGAIVVPLNSWWTGEELEYGLSDSGAKLAVVDGERLESIKPHLKNLNLGGLLVVRGVGNLAGGDDWEEVVAPYGAYADLPDTKMPDVALEPEDNATIFYTSGTTGKPKGALGTHRNICGNLLSLAIGTARSMMRRGEIPQPPDPDGPKPSTLISVPLFHATGCHAILCGTTFGGGKLVMMYKWDPLKAMQLIQEEKIKAFGGVPAMVWQVLEHPHFKDYDLSSVESISYGGAPSAPELVTRIKEEFPQVQPGNGYGLTETSSVTSQNSAEDYVNRPNSAGPAIPVCDIKVVDAEGKELGPNEVGELWIKGPNVVSGYWNKPEATAESITDGWLHTGDLVRVDEEGFIFILDRAKDMLIRGGENVYCVEVEDALYAHEDVMDAAVVGIPHKVLGEEVGAIVQIKPGAKVTEEKLRAFVGEHIAAFKVPVKIELRTEPLPRNANGKILKRQLKDEFLQSLGVA